MLISWSDLMQARNVSGSFELVDGIRWSQVSIFLIESLIEPAFTKWIEDEQALENGKIDKVHHQFGLPPFLHIGYHP